MIPQLETVLKSAAEELHRSQDDLMVEGLRSFLEHQLRAVQTEIFRIGGQYGVSSVEEMEGRYRDGTLEEADSWRDAQRLDHLEYKRDRLLELLEALP